MPTNRFALIATIFGCLILAFIARPYANTKGRNPESLTASSADTSELATAEPADPVNNSTFYTMRADLRRCLSPLCGGYWVRRVNQTRTRCADGSWKSECYVAEIDWNGQTQIEPNKALVRGNLIAKQFPRFGNLGAFRVTESWQAATDKAATGTFYRVRDRGVRCIIHPCLSHVESKLNAAAVRNIAGADLSGAGAGDELAGEASRAMTEAAGVMVAGNHAVVTGPGGTAQTLRATQFYLRAGAQSRGQPSSSSLPGTKPCVKTGCSSEICADHNVPSPCIFRQEYACYQKATCERQADGNCGFTRTPELSACLSRR